MVSSQLNLCRTGRRLTSNLIILTSSTSPTSPKIKELQSFQSRSIWVKTQFTFTRTSWYSTSTICYKIRKRDVLENQQNSLRTTWMFSCSVFSTGLLQFRHPQRYMWLTVSTMLLFMRNKLMVLRAKVTNKYWNLAICLTARNLPMDFLYNSNLFTLLTRMCTKEPLWSFSIKSASTSTTRTRFTKPLKMTTYLTPLLPRWTPVQEFTSLSRTQTSFISQH